MCSDRWQSIVKRGVPRYRGGLCCVQVLPVAFLYRSFLFIIYFVCLCNFLQKLHVLYVCCALVVLSVRAPFVRLVLCLCRSCVVYCQLYCLFYFILFLFNYFVCIIFVLLCVNFFLSNFFL